MPLVLNTLSRARSVAIAFLSVGLAACGGGGGSSPTTGKSAPSLLLPLLLLPHHLLRSLQLSASPAGSSWASATPAPFPPEFNWRTTVGGAHVATIN
jgi:hypothetical protein